MSTQRAKQKRTLTLRHKLFVQEYLKDLNGKQAAIRAGYAAHTATIAASQLLTNPNVQAELERGRKLLQEKTGITQERVLNELAIIAFADLADYVTIDPDTGGLRARPFVEMPEGASRALESVSENRAIKKDASGTTAIVYDKVNFKMHDKQRALEALAKHLGLLTDKGEINQNIVYRIIYEKQNKAKNAGTD